MLEVAVEDVQQKNCMEYSVKIDGEKYDLIGFTKLGGRVKKFPFSYVSQVARINGSMVPEKKLSAYFNARWEQYLGVSSRAILEDDIIALREQFPNLICEKSRSTLPHTLCSCVFGLPPEEIERRAEFLK